MFVTIVGDTFRNLIALCYPTRSTSSLFDQLSSVLDHGFISLGNPYLEEVYKLKMTDQPLKVAIMRWGNHLEEGGLIAWTITGEGSVDLLNNDQAFNILSDLHFYCHGREQHNEQLNKEAEENALGLQQVLREIMHPTSTPDSYALSEDSQFQLSSIQSLQPDNETISTPDNSCHGVIVPAIGHHCMSNIDGPEFRIIKS